MLQNNQQSASSSLLQFQMGSLAVPPAAVSGVVINPRLCAGKHDEVAGHQR
jgi:hypothetical protein